LASVGADVIVEPLPKDGSIAIFSVQGAFLMPESVARRPRGLSGNPLPLGGPKPSRVNRGVWRYRSRLVGLWLCGCLGLAWAGGCSSTATPPTATEAIKPGPVTVVIELGSEQKSHQFDEVQPGTTIAELMAQIEDPLVRLTGSGSMAFVESIGELGTDRGLGWTFRVNGEWADRGIGAFPLEPPAEIRWTHGAFESSAP